MTGGPVLLIGCGRMGSALLRGWLAAGIPSVTVVEPERSDIADLLRDPRVHAVSYVSDLPAGLAPSEIVLAVKPQMMADIMAETRRFAASGALVVSIAAGKSLRYFTTELGPIALVRAMPNLPASIGKGITVAVANGRVDATARERADLLLSACGSVVWVEDEALIDPVTAVSGSGPAYVFLLIEAMAAAGEKAGLPAELAMRLARETVAGTGELLRVNQAPADELRRAVSSPGGTTLAALGELMSDDGLQPLLDRAIAAAAKRAGELGS
jgi:pyrroline-5-carboxylate reductase